MHSRSVLILRALSLLLVGCAFGWAATVIRTPIVLLQWKRTLLGLLSLEFMAGIALFFSGPAVSTLLSFCRFCVSLIIGFPLCGDFVIETLLLCSILIDIGIQYPAVAAGIISCLLIGATAAMQQPFTLWGIPSPAPLPAVVLLGSLLGAFTVSLVILIRVLDARITDQTSHLDQMRDMVSRISSANVGFQNYARIIEIKSKADERMRISREIHDSTGYALTNIRMLMESGLRDLDGKDAELREILMYAREQSTQCLEKMRISMRNLRSIECHPEPFTHEVRRIVSHFEIATGTGIGVDFCNLRDIEDTALRDVLYAIIQEGMINALRHGSATFIQILFWMGPDSVTMILRDNGSGATSITEGIGLSGMRERVAYVGGVISFNSTDDGFEISVTVPYRERS